MKKVFSDFYFGKFLDKKYVIYNFLRAQTKQKRSLQSMQTLKLEVLKNESIQ